MRPATARTGLRTTSFPDTQLKLPCTTSCPPVAWPLTDTLNVFFSPALENTNVAGETCTFNDPGTSTFAVYVDYGGPTLVTVRFTVNGVGCRGTVMVG